MYPSPKSSLESLERWELLVMIANYSDAFGGAGDSQT